MSQAFPLRHFRAVDSLVHVILEQIILDSLVHFMLEQIMFDALVHHRQSAGTRPVRGRTGKGTTVFTRSLGSGAHAAASRGDLNLRLHVIDQKAMN